MVDLNGRIAESSIQESCLDDSENENKELEVKQSARD